MRLFFFNRPYITLAHSYSVMKWQETSTLKQAIL